MSERPTKATDDWVEYALALEADRNRLREEKAESDEALLAAVEGFLGWASPGDEKNPDAIASCADGFRQEARGRLVRAALNESEGG